MIRTFGKFAPAIHKTAFVHDSAEVIGKVRLAAGSSVWPLCVLRGDEEPIAVGADSNIQDLTVIHTRTGHPTVLAGGHRWPPRRPARLSRRRRGAHRDGAVMEAQIGKAWSGPGVGPRRRRSARAASSGPPARSPRALT